MSRLLLDTNFLLDFVDETRSDSAAAATLFGMMARGEHQGVVAASSLKDVYYLMRKRGSDQEARDWIRVFIRAFDVEELDAEVCSMALESDEPDFEDGCIRAIAERMQADFIITRDRKAFARSWVKSYAPREFVELFAPKDTTQG